MGKKKQAAGKQGAGAAGADGGGQGGGHGGAHGGGQGAGRRAKLPKELFGVKLPKELRRQGEAWIERAQSPAGQQAIASALTAVAGMAASAVAAKAAEKAAKGAAPAGGAGEAQAAGAGAAAGASGGQRTREQEIGDAVTRVATAFFGGLNKRSL
ncbi:hypothetical protein KZ813_16615 [Sphingomonas sp. RHCKR7]|uniref:hypothetical protein n=1 Tax=Sphingomonas folli TaxID=2862497 RepID=UPI001CA50864|nr:hypothetical protein [Sphingomonas folli]MBW6528468.1 hypothetical protein [Sphingomonas folli]